MNTRTKWLLLLAAVIAIGVVGYCAFILPECHPTEIGVQGCESAP